MAQRKTSDAQLRASAKWKTNHMHRIPLDVRNEYYDDILKPAAVRAGEPVNTFIRKAIDERIARLSAADAEILSQVVQALPRPYTVAFRTMEQFPSWDVKASPRDAQKVVEASSEAEARVAFFGWVKEQMQTDVAFEDATTIGMKRDDGVIEICEIEKVEEG